MMPTRPDPFETLTRGDAAHPPGVGTAPPVKFAPDGAVQPFAGNTILCHIDPASDAHAALAELQNALKAGPLAGAFAFLPPSSLHMTVFEGIAPVGPWPEGVPASTPRNDVSRTLEARLDGLTLPQGARIAASNLHAAHSVTVAGADAAEEAALRRTRSLLREATGIRPAGFDDYVFHITLAYRLRWFAQDEARDLLARSDAAFQEAALRLSSIALGPPEFCDFETMHHFEPRRLL